MVSGIQLNNIKTTSPALKTQTVPVIKNSPQTDTVEIQQKKKKKFSKGAKWTIGVVGTFATLAGAGLAYLAHKRSQIAKLYKEKLILSNLGENLQFREASTVEEGIKFAKEVLKIPEVDSNFTLEAINETNRGLVKVSNANKGQLFMPRALRYHDASSQNWYAFVNRNIESKHFGELTINSSFFDHARLDKGLKRDLFDKSDARFFKKRSDGMMDLPFFDNMAFIPSDDVYKLMEKYYQAPESMSISDKRILYQTMIEGLHKKGTVYKRAPIDFLKDMETVPQYKAYVNPNYEELGKITTKEQVKYVENILKKMLDDNQPYINQFDLAVPESTIYHEMGHLQDYAENLKRLDLAKFKLSNIHWVIRDSWVEANKLPIDKPERFLTRDEIGNHWGSIVTDKELKNFFKNNPDEFKKCFPDLHEFLTNQQYQQTAGKVSAYAQSGIGEFIAEVYRDMISGKQIPEDVKRLYEKYNGPKLP